MWIITKYGFVSLVTHERKPDFVRARARRREHLADNFDLFDADIIDLGPDAPDYRWHADVPRAIAASRLYECVMDHLNYTSHVTEEVAQGDQVMYRAMLDCWGALYRLQKPINVADRDSWTRSSEQFAAEPSITDFPALLADCTLGADEDGPEAISNEDDLAERMLTALEDWNERQCTSTDAIARVRNLLHELK